MTQTKPISVLSSSPWSQVRLIGVCCCWKSDTSLIVEPECGLWAGDLQPPPSPKSIGQKIVNWAGGGQLCDCRFALCWLCYLKKTKKQNMHLINSRLVDWYIISAEHNHPVPAVIPQMQMMIYFFILRRVSSVPLCLPHGFQLDIHNDHITAAHVDVVEAASRRFCSHRPCLVQLKGTLKRLTGWCGWFLSCFDPRPLVRTDLPDSGPPGRGDLTVACKWTLQWCKCYPRRSMRRWLEEKLECQRNECQETNVGLGWTHVPAVVLQPNQSQASHVVPSPYRKSPLKRRVYNITMVCLTTWFMPPESTQDQHQQMLRYVGYRRNFEGFALYLAELSEL